jgi:putative CocE/NonD family hydrolase
LKGPRTARCARIGRSLRPVVEFISTDRIARVRRTLIVLAGPSGCCGRFIVLAVCASFAGLSCELADAADYTPRAKPISGPYAPFVGSYEVALELSQRIPMRDGIGLVADIYKPVGAGPQLPAVYMATPYGKQRIRDVGDGGYNAAGHFFASHGYAVIVQDVRGKFESDGKFVVEHGHGADGFDTVRWITGQPWSNGLVGTFGCSYSGETQLYLARYHPPGLAAQIVVAAGGLGGRVRPDGNSGGRYGGVQGLKSGFVWMREDMATVRVTAPTDLEGGELSRLSNAYGELRPKLPQVDYGALFWTLPVSEMMRRAQSSPNDWVRYKGSELNDPWWETFERPTEQDQVSAPALHITSWPDSATLTGSIYFWNLFREIGDSAKVRENQFLVISPADHCRELQLNEKQLMGTMEVGDPRLDLWSMYLAWFGSLLRGEGTDVGRWPKVRFYTTGLNKWQDSAMWPPADVRTRILFLAANKGANSRYGDGQLVTSPPSRRQDVFQSDPNNPVPSNGQGGSAATFGGGPDHRGEAAREARHDVLVYTTRPLLADTEVTGPLYLALNLESTAPDADIAAWLVDVFPDGTAYDVQEGIFRLRYHSGYHQSVLLQRGKTYAVTVGLRSTSHLFKKAHRIRITIAGSNFPKYVRNLQTGGDNFRDVDVRQAIITLHSGGEDGSQLRLPIRGRPGWPTR